MSGNISGAYKISWFKGFKLNQTQYIKIVGGFKNVPTNNEEENKKWSGQSAQKKILAEREVEAVWGWRASKLGQQRRL